MNDPARLARLIADFSAEQPDRSITLALTNPPSATDVAKLLPSSTTSGDNKVVLAGGATVTLVRVKPGDTRDEVFRKAFAFASVTREQLVSVLKDLPPSATVRVEPPNRRSVIIVGDIPRVVKTVRDSPSGTLVSAKWASRSVRYPRLK